jgi:hypothetical protein
LKIGKQSCGGLLPAGYKPELDVTQKLDTEKTQWYQQIIGILCWTVEPCRVEFLMPAYQANHCNEHLEELYLIIHYFTSKKLNSVNYD